MRVRMAGQDLNPWDKHQLRKGLGTHGVPGKLADRRIGEQRRPVIHGSPGSRPGDPAPAARNSPEPPVICIPMVHHEKIHSRCLHSLRAGVSALF